MDLTAAHRVPEMMRGSFIMKGYRANCDTWQRCLKSVFRAHNETLNVWTHFIGFLIFAGLLIHTIYHSVADTSTTPTFPSTTNFSLHLHPTFFDMAQKYYDYYNDACSNEHIHPISPSSSTCPLPTSLPTCPLPTYHNHSYASFTTFPAFSSNHHQAYSFFNFTNLPSLYCDLSSLPHLPTPPFSFDFVTFPSFSPLTDEEHTAHTQVQRAMQSKSEELKKFLEDCRDHIQRKMHSFHDSLEIYLKEIEKSVNEFSSSTHVSVANLSERLSEMQQRFDDTLAKFFSPKSKLPIMVFLFSGMVCFLGSTLYHTFGCQSVGHCVFFLKIDYSGISALIAGSLVPFVWYVFHGLTHWQCFYLINLFVLACVVFFISFSERFSRPEMQPYRALCFVLMSTFVVVPFLHAVILYGTVELYSFQRGIISVLLYILAVVAYVSRVPECLFPGKCDFLLQSHQVFHTFIVAAALVWYSFALRLMDSYTYVN